MYSEKSEFNNRFRFVFITKFVVPDNTSLCIDYPVEYCKIAVFLFGSILPNLEAETAVWPIHFLINILTALKISVYFIVWVKF